MGFQFVTSCVSANGDDISEMQDVAKDISSHAFIYGIAKKEGIDLEVVDMLGYSSWAEDIGGGKSARKLFVDDFALSCHRSFYQGIPCLYVQHSRIEHVFIDTKHLPLVLRDEADILARQTKRTELTDELDEITNMTCQSLAERKVGLVNFVKKHEATLCSMRIPIQSLVYARDTELFSFAEKVNERIQANKEKEKDGPSI